MTIAHDDRDDEFLHTACQVMRASPGSAALESLGWWELLSELADADARAGVFAAFRAQGRELADSAALGGLLAQPFIAGTAIAPGTVQAAILRHSPGRGPVWVLVGDPDGRRLLFDVPREGVSIVDADAVVLHPIDVPGGAVLHEIAVDLDAHPPFLPEGTAGAARIRSLQLGRVAAAAEILGAAERAVGLAVQHAIDREQFGRPIGTFQAVRHLLAWAKTDCVALDGVVDQAIALLDDPPPRSGEVAKALAGRNGRRACERSLQVLGGIGFTAEHPHHHLHSRVLVLDGLLGSSAELTRDLGTWLRTSGADPGFAAAALVRGPR